MKNIHQTLHHAQVISIRLILLVVLLGSWGCSTRYLREAQNHWNRGAQSESAIFAHGYLADQALTTQANANTEYKLALSLLESELAKNTDELRKEKLYGTALMLKAMCLWRLADLESDDSTYASRFATTTASIRNAIETQSSNNANTIVLGERDQILLTALPGLRDHDKGLSATDYEKATDYFKSALSILNEATTQAPDNHPIRVYLYLAQLSTFRAWQSAAFIHCHKEGKTLTETGDFINQKVLATDTGPGGATITPAKAIIAQLLIVANRDAVLKEQVKQLEERLGL